MGNHWTIFQIIPKRYMNTFWIIPVLLQKLGSNSINLGGLWRHWHPMVQISVKRSSNRFPPIHTLGSDFNDINWVEQARCFSVQYYPFLIVHNYSYQSHSHISKVILFSMNHGCQSSIIRPLLILSKADEECFGL